MERFIRRGWGECFRIFPGITSFPLAGGYIVKYTSVGGNVKKVQGLSRAYQCSNIDGETGGLNPTPQQLSRWVRGHWEIENGVFWVLDVTYQEDRNHARKVGRPLHAIRCMAINVIRQQGFCYVPDGHRAASARPDRGLVWLGG